MSRIKTNITPADIILCAVLTAASVLVPLFCFGADGGTVTVTVDGKSTFYSANTDADIPIESNGINLTVSVKNGEVCVSSSNCPDKICMHTGHIKKSGEVIICAPAKVIIGISGKGGDGNADAYVGQ